MSQKIDWYREVLELEPGSKVFMPLAKLLVSEEKFGEAVTTLKQGLLRHPEFVEARLLLVELLATYGTDPQVLQDEVTALGSLLRTYPGFWEVWSADLASLPEMKDAVLALRFFAAALQGKPITWGKVIEQGLRSVLNDTCGVNTSSYPSVAQTTQTTLTDASGEEHPVYEEEPEEADGTDTFSDEVDENESETVSLTDASSFKIPDTTLSVISNSLSADEGDSDEEEEGDDEIFSLRTRSMADILAEQGDIEGAIDIYNDLIETASTSDLAELQSRLVELAKMQEHPPTLAKEDSAHGESKRLAELMEGLAQRLEARSR